MLSRTIDRKQRGRRWLSAVTTLALVATSVFVVSGTAAGLSQSEFELDKNATNNLATEHLGTLKSRANAGSTSIIVCERQYDHDGNNATPPLVTPIPATPFNIQIDAEVRTVTSFGAISST